MADSKLTALSELASISADDLIYVVDDPAGTPTEKKAVASTARRYTMGRTRRTISSGDTVIASDHGNVIEATSGTFTLAFTAVATLAAGFWCTILNSGTGNVTLDPDSTEQIDGATSWVLYPGGMIDVFCTGSAFESVALNGMWVTFDANGTFTKPLAAGLTAAEIHAWGAGGSGGRGGSGDGGGGGGGGGYNTRKLPLSSLGSTETVTIGAGGPAQTVDDTDGTAGGNTTFGSLLTGYGGGRGESASVFGGGGGGGTTAVGSDGTTTAGGAGGTGWGGKFAVASIDASAIVQEGVASGTASACAGAGFSYGGTGGINNSAQPGGTSIYGGGGGGGGSATNTNSAGGNSVYGGGGGGGGSDTGAGSAGGTSTHGGNGGAGATGASAATAGTQPGGGGGGSETGNSGKGGDGRVIVYVT